MWRYDPIVISATPVEFHLANFESLCRRLCGVVDEVVISFMQVYAKTQRNMDCAANTAGFQWAAIRNH